MVKQVTKYVATDGTEFSLKTLAEAYERKIAYDASPEGKLEKKYQGQLNTYWYKGLCGNGFQLSSYGVWKIYGEDDNADFSGPHHQPKLATVEGTLEQAIRYAVAHKDYFSWGAGGEIQPLYPDKVIKL